MGEKLQTAKEALEVTKQAGKLGLEVGRTAASAVPWLMSVPGLIALALVVWILPGLISGVLAVLLAVALIGLAFYFAYKLFIVKLIEGEATEAQTAVSVGIIIVLALFGTHLMQPLGAIHPGIVTNAPSGIQMAGVLAAEQTTPTTQTYAGNYAAVILQLTGIVGLFAAVGYYWYKYSPKSKRKD